MASRFADLPADLQDAVLRKRTGREPPSSRVTVVLEDDVRGGPQEEMLSLPLVCETRGSFIAILDVNVDAITDEDYDNPEPWTQHFVLDLRMRPSGEIVVGNNSDEWVEVARVVRGNADYAYPAWAAVAKRFAMKQEEPHANNSNPHPLIEMRKRVTIDEPNENSAHAVIMEARMYA
jgi:hypothetical protein